MIRVMVVDDSPLVRKIASDILNGEPGIDVVTTAATAEFAIGKLERERPDVITMDIEMPGMGGLQAIREIMRRRPTPVLLLSAHAQRGAELTLQALEAGAVDFIAKPSPSLSGGLDAVARELVEKVRSASTVDVSGKAGCWEDSNESGIARDKGGERLRPKLQGGSWTGGKYELVAIGTSTGGPVALKTVLSGLPAHFPLPVVVVQHMPEVFTKAFAERLDATCAIAVKEAADGDTLVPGQVLIARGDYHLTVSRFNSAPHVSLNHREPVSGHRPSVDVLMRSVAREYGSKALGVIMTGMGTDGADGINELHRQGGYIVAQDRESSVIFGMNREVIMKGDADEVAPVRQISRVLLERVCAGISS